ncbi:TIGR03032 family protein [Dapis sp. BLCC M229]|uniref:TIGR03032 family protein n=1 Tax=Dapis sp. BLCC M229 TaxID=3400188 RepID=UPI003CEB0A46
MTQTPLEISSSRNFLEWLNLQQISLAFTTYQTNRLFLMGIKPDGKLSTFERLFTRAMGLAATTDRLYVATRYQIWQFDNNLRQGEIYKHYDKVYVPRVGNTTGDLDIHDLAVDRDGNLVFVNTLYNCLATLSDTHSFKSIWQPKFISKLAAEDRCHLNGLAMRDGKVGYVSVVSQSDMTDGWRDNRRDGGCLIDVSSDEVVCNGLSMPHSPRYYQGKLWVLNSGRGEFGYVDPASGKFEAITFCPGYPRGLTFYDNYAVLGISKPRDKTFTGLDLDGLLTEKKINPRCGLLVINLQTGDIVHWVWFDGIITELYDIQVLPNVRCGMSLGFKTDEIAQMITFETTERQTIIEDNTRDAAQQHLAITKQLKQAGNIEGAITNLRQAITLKPDFAAAYNNLGTILQTQEQFTEAKQCYEKGLELNPNIAQAHSNLATIWQLEGNIEQAKRGLTQALQLNPHYTPALTNLAGIYQQEGNFEEAKKLLNQAIKQDPQNLAAQLKIVTILSEEGYLNRALAILNSLLKQHPENAEIYLKIAQIHEFRGEQDLAATAYEKVMALEPDNEIYGAFDSSNRLKLTDWSDYDQNLVKLDKLVKEALEKGKTSPIPPYILNSYPIDNALHLAVAKAQAASFQISIKDVKKECNFVHQKRTNPKINLGFISADFRTHVVGNLVQDLFSYFDRDKFTIYGYYSLNIEDENTERIRGGCDCWQNFYQVSAQDAATKIYQDEIDILIDLGGYTVYSRPDILALQPAPIQIQFLGYPNTMGADFVQYIIADKWLIPENLSEYYTEEILYLSQSYFSAPLKTSDTKFSKADFGFSEDTFVFCCFNRHDKIEPEAFAAWMTILEQVPNGILWLGDGVENVKQNLWQAAETYNIDQSRLVFAEKIDWSEYLARYQVTDLFLDTFIYNAGSTGIAALWSGVPVLTRAGKSNAGRIGASLCAAVGLEELICQTTEDYIQQAIDLAHNPQKLASLRQQLNTDKEQKPLFNLPRFVKELETVLQQLID